jgi:hypothetical protein
MVGPKLLAAVALLATAAVAGGCGEGEASTRASVTVTVHSGATSAATAATTATSTATTSSSAAAGTSASTTTATSSASTAQAEAICGRRNRELKAAAPVGASLHEIVATASARAAIQRAALAELRALAPPAQLAHDWRMVLAGSERTLRSVEQLARLASAGGAADVRRETALASGASQLGLLVAGARAGVKQCASIPGPSLAGIRLP